MATTSTSPTAGETATTSTGASASTSKAPANETIKSTDVKSPGSSEVATAAVETPEATADDQSTQLVGIRYTQQVNERSITVADFKEGAGVKADKKLVWDKRNGFVANVEDMNDETAAYLLSQPDFEAVTAADL